MERRIDLGILDQTKSKLQRIYISEQIYMYTYITVQLYMYMNVYIHNLSHYSETT
jgi:hypothetical protein